MALTTKESAHLLRIEQMTHIIVQKNGELLYQDEGYKDFSVIGNMSEINVSVFKLEKGYQYYKKNIGRTIRAFEDLDVELLEDFDNKLVGIIKQYEIPLELKSVEELTDLIYGFPNQEYRDVNNTFSFIWGFLNEVQRHDLIAKYAEYTGWKFLRYRSGILCGAVYGLGVGLVNTVKALWDLIIMLYNFEAAYLGQLKDHFIDLRGSLEDDLKWLEHSSNIIATVSKSIFDDPGIILEFFSATWEMFNGFIDSTTAEWMEKEPFNQGISVGTNIGQGLFEIIIAIIGTKGVDKVAKLAKSGKFVALLEKMNLGRLNKLISKVDELKKLKAASTGLSKMDGLVLSTNGKERVVDLLTEFDNVDDVIAKLSKLGNDFPQIVDKLTDTDELTRFISKIDNLEADKFDDLTNMIEHVDNSEEVINYISRFDKMDDGIIQLNAIGIDDITDISLGNTIDERIVNINIREIADNRVKNANVIKQFENSNPVGRTYNKANIQKLISYNDEVKTILAREGISIDKFNELRMIQADNLSNIDAIMMERIRRSIPAPSENTLMQKIIPMSDIEGYLKSEQAYTQIGGFITEAGDTKSLSTFEDVYNGLRLDYDGSKFNIETEGYGVIRFKTAELENLEIPFGNRMGGTPQSPPSCQNGYLSTFNDKIIPEYAYSKNTYVHPLDGAELYIVNKNGVEKLVGIYDVDKLRFEAVLNGGN